MTDLTVACRRFDELEDARRLHEFVAVLAVPGLSVFLSRAEDVEDANDDDVDALDADSLGKSFVTFISSDRRQIDALVAVLPAAIRGERFDGIPPAMLDAMFRRRRQALAGEHDIKPTIDHEGLTRYDYPEPRRLGRDGRMR